MTRNLLFNLVVGPYGGFCSRRSISFTTNLKGVFTRHNGNWAQRVVRRLDESERQMLLTELNKRMGDSANRIVPGQTLDEKPNIELNPSYFRLVFIANGLPFIGFGFLDNAIMIVAGEYIDLTFASIFGLSTMAAAGLGNLVSDICGLGMARYVERFAAKMGFVVPPLTTEQYKSRLNRSATILGRCTGITIGCLLGLLPLFFFDSKSSSNGHEGKNQSS